MTLNPRKIVLGLNSIRQPGGIAQVAQNLIKVIEAKVQNEPNLYQLKKITFDQRSQRGHDFLNKSLIAKVRFFLAIQKASLSYTHFIYDSCNMAQVHSQLFLSRKPNLTCIHGIEVWDNAKPNWIRACQHSDVLISNSYYTRARADQIHRGFARAQVCWLGTNTDEVPKNWTPMALRNPDVLIIGRIDSSENYKGHFELIKSWPKVINAVPEAKLHIAGSGTGVPHLREITNKSKVGNRILFHGHVSNRSVGRVVLP